MPRFFVVLKDGLFPVNVPDHTIITAIFDDLKSSSEAARRIFGRLTSYDQYQYFKLKNPVPLPCRAYDAGEIVPICLRQSNWEQVHPYHSINVLSTTLGTSHVYLVIQAMPDAAEQAITDLRTNYAELFNCLQLTVSKLQIWTQDDVITNLKGGRLLDPEVTRPPEIFEIEEALARKRTYIRPLAHERADFTNASLFPTHFDKFFARAANPPVDVANREFATFFNVIRCFNEDSDQVERHTSSALKASNFIVYFILPPFFSRSSTHYQLHQEEQWNFPIFLSAQNQADSWCRFSPKNDVMVSSPSFLLPFLICEAVSRKEAQDRWCMLLQAIAVTRAGQYLMKDDAPKPFFVVAVYLRANLTAERYVVTHIGVEERKEVCIAKKLFDLSSVDDALTFLREMYNLAVMSEELAGYLDNNKRGTLSHVKNVAKNLMSLTSKAKEKRTAPLASIPEAEGDGDDEAQDSLGVFDADDIQGILEIMNYKINFVLFGFPLVASVSNIADESKVGYLKFVRHGGKEVEILRYLIGLNSPANHTISGARIWPVHGGNVISMPSAGSWLTSLKKPDAHLWSVAKQLFEAVDFMHRHGVAHMDLKPQNILIPVDGGRLSIVDFNSSLRVKGVGHKFRGIVGTTGYIAPEVVGSGSLYSAVRADLWSCGKALEELCNMCQPSVDRDTLFEISWQLMNEDPDQRPMMSDVMDGLTRCTMDAAITRGSLSFYSVAPPEENA